MNDVESHIDFLFEGLEGFVYVPTKQNGDWKANYFAYPSNKQELVDFIVTTGQECDVYVAPTIFKEKSAKKSAVKTTQVVWIEYDGQEPAKLLGLPEPSRIVQSSLDSHFHIYWKVGCQNAQTIEDINRRLTYYLEADSSGWDINQVLRPPGTRNFKRNLPVTLRISNPTADNYSPTDFDGVPQVDRPLVTYVPSAIPDAAHLISQLPKKLIRLIEDTNVQEPHRSSYLFRTGQELAEYGIPEIAIISILQHIDDRIGKFKGRDDRIIRLSEIASLATFKHHTEEEISFYSPFEIVELEEDLEFILPGVLPFNGQMVLSGAPGVGKTQYALALAMSLCQNIKVGFLSLEMTALELKYIFSRQMKALPKEWEEAYKYNFWITAPDETKWVDIEDMLDSNPVDLLIVDSVSELSPGDINEENMRELIRWLRVLRRKSQTAVMLLHHNRKATGDNKKPNKLSDLYGSYLLGAKSDSVICMWETGTKNEIELFGLKARFGLRTDTKIYRIPETLTFSDKIATTEVKELEAAGEPEVVSETGPVGGTKPNLKFSL